MTRGWHFCADKDGKPILRDGSPCPTIGDTEVYDGDPIMCMSGLHWSPRAIDAIAYAPGSWVRIVEGEPVKISNDKVVGKVRYTIAGPVNVYQTLRRFTILCTLRTLRKYADSEKRDALLPFVWCALKHWRLGAWIEADDTTFDALDAVWSNDWAAIEAAAWSPILDVVKYAARSAARSSAQAYDKTNEKNWQNQILETMLMKHIDRKD